MKRFTLSLLAIVVVFAWSTLGHAQSVKFCFKIQNVAFTDSGQGAGSNQEDVWTTTANRYLRGVHVLARKQGTTTTLWAGFTGDGDYSGSPGTACTDTFTPSSGVNGTWQFRVLSSGYVSNNYLRSRDRATGSVSTVWVNNYLVLGGSGTYDVSVAPGTEADEFRVYLAASEALSRHAGGMSGNTYEIRVGNQVGTEGCQGPCYLSADEIVWIPVTFQSAAQRKFLITHEFGHAFADYGTTGALVNGNCSYSIDDCPGVGGTHGFDSEEANSCALDEGFASFYSAATWNNTTETDCWLEYWGTLSGVGDPLLSCEGSTTVNGDSYGTKWMESNCDADWDDGGTTRHDWSGLGNENDWLHALWDMHTGIGGGCTNEPSFNEILGFLDDADDWPALTAYNELNDEATGGSQSSDVEDCWDATDDYNGIDHNYP